MLLQLEQLGSDETGTVVEHDYCGDGKWHPDHHHDRIQSFEKSARHFDVLDNGQCRVFVQYDFG